MQGTSVHVQSPPGAPSLVAVPSKKSGAFSMLAKLRTFSLVGIEAVPVEVEVDVSPGASAQDRAGRLARGGGQGKHASRRAGAGQLAASCGRTIASSSTSLRPNCPSRPRRSICRSRSACWPAAGRSVSDKFERICRRRRVGARRQHAADQGRAVDGHRRRGPARPARAGRARAPAPPKRRWSKRIDIIPSQPGRRRSASSPASSRSNRRPPRLDEWFQTVFAIRRRLRRRPRPGNGQAGHHHRRRRQP